MTQLEDRLRSTFEAYREQVRADDTLLDPSLLPPSRRPGRRRTAVAVALAAAVVAVVLGIATSLGPSNDAELRMAASGSRSTAAQFDRAASAMCRAIGLGLSGVKPRFSTPEAYRVVAESRAGVVAAARAALVEVLPPRDPDRRAAGARVAILLRSAAASADTAVQRASADDLAGAAAALDEVDRKLDEVGTVLAEAGVQGCSHEASR